MHSYRPLLMTRTWVQILYTIDTIGNKKNKTTLKQRYLQVCEKCWSWKWQIK